MHFTKSILTCDCELRSHRFCESIKFSHLHSTAQHSSRPHQCCASVLDSVEMKKDYRDVAILICIDTVDSQRSKDLGLRLT